MRHLLMATVLVVALAAPADAGVKSGFKRVGHAVTHALELVVSAFVTVIYCAAGSCN